MAARLLWRLGNVMPDSLRDSRQRGISKLVLFPWRSLRLHGIALGWVSAGKLMLLTGNALLILFLSQRLRLDTYGIFVAVVGAQVLVSRVLMLGVDAGMIRLKTVGELRGRAEELERAGFRVIARSSVLLVMACLLLGPMVFHYAAPKWSFGVVEVVALGAIGQALVDYVYFYHLSHFAYRKAALVQGGTALARLVLTATASLLIPQSPLPVFLSYTGVVFAVGVWLALAIWWRSGPTPKSAILRKLLSYSLWQGGVNIAGAFSLHQGTFLLVYLGYTSAAGIFGMGLTMSLGFFAIYLGVSEFVFSRIVRIGSRDRLPGFLLKSSGSSVLVSLSCVPVALAIGKIAPYVLKQQLWASIPAFFWLTAAMLVLILQAPFQAACHYLMRPNFVAIGWIVRIVSIALLGWRAAPVYGATGVAAAQLGGSVIGLSTFLVLVLIATRLAPPSLVEAQALDGRIAYAE
jgi:O-antigen/teichoic acid export membrane protein